MRSLSTIGERKLRRCHRRIGRSVEEVFFTLIGCHWQPHPSNGTEGQPIANGRQANTKQMTGELKTLVLLIPKCA